MFLVSEDELQSSVIPPSSSHLDRYAGELTKAETEIQRALSDPGKSLSERLHAVTDAHNKYKNYINQMKPSQQQQQPIRQASEGSHSRSTSPAKASFDSDAPLMALGKTSRPRGKKILEFMQKNSGLRVNSKLEPVIRGQPIDVAHVSDILTWLTANNNPVVGREPEGLEKFMKEMRKVHLPYSLVSNLRRRKMFENANNFMHDYDNDDDDDDVPFHSAPSTVIKSNRKSVHAAATISRSGRKMLASKPNWAE